MTSVSQVFMGAVKETVLTLFHPSSGFNERRMLCSAALHSAHCWGPLSKSKMQKSTAPVMCDYQSGAGLLSKHELTYPLPVRFSATKQLDCEKHKGENMVENDFRSIQSLAGVRRKQNNWIQSRAEARRINVHELRDHVIHTQLPDVSEAWECKDERGKLTFIRSAVCSPMKSMSCSWAIAWKTEETQAFTVTWVWFRTIANKGHYLLSCYKIDYTTFLSLILTQFHRAEKQPNPDTLLMFLNFWSLTLEKNILICQLAAKQSAYLSLMSCQ